MKLMPFKINFLLPYQPTLKIVITQEMLLAKYVSLLFVMGLSLCF